MQEPLQELLADLREAIDAAEAGTGDADELRRLAAELDRRLNEDDDANVVDDLRNEVQEFEVTHPRLAAAIGRAADALSALGL